MAWPFKQDDPPNPQVNPDKKDDPKPPEKSPAELIAEAVKAAIEPLGAAVTKLNEKFEAIEAAAKPPEVKPDPKQPTSVLDDEDKAFRERLAPAEVAILETRADVVRRDVKDEYGELWKAFEQEIGEALKSSPVQFRANPDYVRNVADMIIGRRARGAGYRFDTNTKRFFLEDAGSGGAPAKPDDSTGLTEAQRRVLDRMGVTADQAKKVMSKLNFVQ